MKKHFIIYAPAINSKSAGAHSILESFLSTLPGKNKEDSWKFIGHGDYGPICTRRGIEFSELNLNSQWARRIIYDFFLFRKHFLKKSVPPSIIISMQNTTPRSRNEDKTLTYLHQAIPFLPDFYPSLVKQTKLFLIKHFYYFFIRHGIKNHNSFFIVQSEWLKKILSKRLSLSLDHIFIHRPLPNDITPSDFKKQHGDCFFYPALYQVYKNHLNLIKGFCLAAEEKPGKDFSLEVTLEKTRYDEILKTTGALPENFHLINCGVLKRRETLEKISNAKAVIYPSLLESYGMPIAEALFLNTPVLASNLPYAQELLGKDGSYFNPLEPESIKEAIINFQAKKSEHALLSQDRFQDWDNLLKTFSSL